MYRNLIKQLDRFLDFVIRIATPGIDFNLDDLDFTELDMYSELTSRNDA